MDETDLWIWYALAVVVALDFFFALMRTCILRLSLHDLTRLRNNDNPTFHRVLETLRHRNGLRLVVQSGTLASHLAIGGMAIYLAYRTEGNSLRDLWELLGWLVAAAALIGTLEWLPEVLFGDKTKILRAILPWTERLATIATPLERAFTPRGESNWLLNDDTFQALLQANLQDGRLEQEERAMLRSIMRFGETLVREIMVPRIDMVTVEAQTPLSEATDIFIRTGFSRLPVYREKIDNIIGLLYAKDLLPVWRNGEENKRPLESLVREAYFVPEAKKVDELLAEMQRRRMHMAMVVDEYGGIAGLVTLEDIVEEIIGEIQDEYDAAEEPPDIQPIAEGEFIISGRADIDDVNEALQAEFPSDEADTIGGLLLTVTGHMPSEGEEVRIDGYLFTILEVDQRRIVSVRARRL